MQTNQKGKGWASVVFWQSSEKVGQSCLFVNVLVYNQGHFLSSGGTSTGEPVSCLSVFRKNIQKQKFRDFCLLRNFPQRVASELLSKLW